MKKIIILTFVLISLMAGVAQAQYYNKYQVTIEEIDQVKHKQSEQNKEEKRPQLNINLTIPMYSINSISKLQYNENNKITGFKGFNFRLGYSERRYFKPLKVSSLNPYYEFGTVLLIAPYAKIGVDYTYANPFNSNNLISIGISMFGILSDESPESIQKNHEASIEISTAF